MIARVVAFVLSKRMAFACFNRMSFMQRLKMKTEGGISRNIAIIAQLFPSCITERLRNNGKCEFAIDFDKLRQELSDDIVAEGAERYQFTWPDKRAAVRLANTPTTMTLRPCREESVDFDNTQKDRKSVV